MTQREALVQDNVRTLEQGIHLLEGLDDAVYARPEPRLASSGIGSHVRHCVDFYERLLAGIAAGRVDYDARERDERLETDRGHSLGRLRSLVTRLRELASVEGEHPLHVRMDSAADADEDVPWTASSLDRELQSLISHTVHHYALIAMVLRIGGRETATDFGVAPSTLRYWEESRACAP